MARCVCAHVHTEPRGRVMARCVCVHVHTEPRGDGKHYLCWSHFIAMIHRDQVLFSHSISHVKGDPGHKSGTVEQVSVEAIILRQTLLVVGTTGPLPLGPHCFQWDAG